MNLELPDIQACFRKGRVSRDQIANIRWIIEKAIKFQKKHLFSVLLIMPKHLTVWITADGDYSHEIRRGLLLGRKAMTNLESILKSRDITLPTKVPLVKATVFPVVMYRCENWTIKKAEHQRIDAFKLWFGEDS